MDCLKTVLTYKWYDMIETSVKKQEYRTINEYWVNRLFDWRKSTFNIWECVEQLNSFGNDASIWKYLKPIGDIQFSRAYTSINQTLEVDNIDIGTSVPEWSDNWPGNVFRIHLGKHL